VQFGPPSATGTAQFHDYGFMPITSANTASGGLYIKYDATGTQNFSPTGLPTTATYSKMHYTLMSYVGQAKFGHDATGKPTLSGIVSQAEVGHGDLITGSLATKPDGSLGGNVKVSYDVGAKHFGTMDITVVHPYGDMRPVGPGAFTIDGGNSFAKISLI